RPGPRRRLRLGPRARDRRRLRLGPPDPAQPRPAPHRRIAPMTRTPPALFIAITLILVLTQNAGAAGTFTVTTTADAGPGSLRQAITDANTAAGGTINVTT